MCGIYFIYRRCQINPKKHAILKNRGPDALKIIEMPEYYAAFYRLAIVGLDNGMQPFETTDILLMCNGEIYNHKELETKYLLNTNSSSDCECIIHLYKKFGIEKTLQLLDGEFAFTLYDKKKQIIYAARDKLGRKPLFIGYNTNANDSYKISDIEFASLYGALELTNKIQVIPGQIYAYDVNNYSISIGDYSHFMYNPLDEDITNDQIYDAFVKAVKKRVTQSERTVGFLLSGGFDSSLVLSVALKHNMMQTTPHVFTIGFDENAPDVKSANIMVEYFKEKYGPDCIIWHKVILPIQNGLDAIPSVIKALETYDTTTIRASTPMYLISKYIAENTDVKVVLSGEGSDELFGGYLYFRYAPNDYAFRSEICDLLNKLYLYDVLRADRTTAHFGLEIRPPFLDDEFIKLVLSCDRLTKSDTTTKALIREVVMNKDVLPECILLGKKEAFSDAVGLSWKDAIANEAQTYKFLNIEENKTVNDNVKLSKSASKSSIKAAKNEMSPHIIPETDEATWFQTTFNKLFPNSWHLLPALWLPNQAWVKTGSEPSARVLDVYKDVKNT